MRNWIEAPPNNSFKPNLLRSTNNMAGKACHVVGSATQVGLTQALGIMGKISATRTVAISSLALLVGLIVARVSYFAAGGASFSWPGFFLGIGVVALAYLLSRPIAKAANTNPPGTVSQRRFLQSALWFFVATLVLFTAFIYTDFVWLKFPLFLAIIGGAVSVFAGMVSAFSATRHDA